MNSKQWRTTTTMDGDGNEWRLWQLTTTIDNDKWWQTVTATNGNKQRLQQTMTNGDCDKWRWTTTDDNRRRLQRQQHCRKIGVHKLYSNGVQKRRIFFSSTSCFFLNFIFFFVFSTDLATCSFNHSCSEPAEMEIKKWTLKKWRKPNVYWSGVP
jgi:hypothetical protein